MLNQQSMGENVMGKKKKSKGKHPANPKPSVKKSDSTSKANVALPQRKEGQPYPSAIPGLSNLGNTCFFNVVLQNMSQSHYFRVVLNLLVESPSYTMTLELSNSEGVLKLNVVLGLGELTTKLNSFLKTMQEGGKVLNPRPVFSEICKKASRFASYSQQDSQELLRYMLDSLKSEEIHRIKHAILNSYGVGGKDNHSHLTDKQKSDIKAYGMQALTAHTFVDHVFGGMLVSTVKCEECDSCTTMKESFLDLSLPIVEDKMDISYSGGYQARGRSKNNNAGSELSVLYGTAKKTSGETVGDGEAVGDGEREKMSKHQKKKMEREARKAAKKEAKKNTTKSIQEYLKTEEKSNKDNNFIAATMPPPTNCSLQTKSGANTEANTEVSGRDLDKKTENSSLVDPATGESALSTSLASNDTEPHSDTHLTEEINLSDPELNRDALIISDYASTGPQPDKFNEQPPELVISSQTIEEDSLIIENFDINLEDNNRRALYDNDPVVSEVGRNGAVHCEETDDKSKDSVCESDQERHKVDVESDEDAATESSASAVQDYEAQLIPRVSLEELNCKIDSLHYSLKSFCMPEYLTGDNKFACAVCTKKLTMKNSKNIKEKRESNSSEDNDGAGTALSLEEVDTSDCCAAGDDGPKEIGVNADIGSTDEGSIDERDSEDVVSEDSSITKPAATTAFCDASKQLLIHRPPFVLTLHLKRFSQQGRRVKKNGKHISFPFLLDIRPFCTDQCDELCDDNGRLMYSLYGVVEHSGGMQAGHYVAYVKLRQPPNMDTITSSLSCTEYHKQQDSASGVESSECGNKPTKDPLVVKRRFDYASSKGQWFFASDSRVKTVNETEVMKSQAYLLFYERLPFER